MSFAAAFLLAAAAVQAAPVDAPAEPDRGARVESAQVSVTILRPAVLKGGSLISSRDGATPRSQRQSRDGRVTYEFE
jgi:hypothetical protein